MNCWVINHRLEVRCNVDQTRALSASDLSTYNRPTNCDLLLKLHALELFYFDFNALNIDKNGVDAFRFSLFDLTPPITLAVLHAFTSVCKVFDAKNDVTQSNVQETANNARKNSWKRHKTAALRFSIFRLVICCRIKYSSFPMPI